MANSYFQFKQFKIEQGQTAMKVCTDACLFGAYIKPQNKQKILDIGTGTGLLALMLAQKTAAHITAVEIEENAYNQALENVNNSIFASQIQVIHQSIQDFAQNYQGEKFDLIVSNPPFFKNNWKATEKAKNLALHSENLDFEDLLKAVAGLLNKEGVFWVLLPAYEATVLAEKARKYNLKAIEKIQVYNHPQASVFRVMQAFAWEGREIHKSLIINDLCIKNLNKEYSLEFRNLLKDYYLIF